MTFVDYIQAAHI